MNKQSSEKHFSPINFWHRMRDAPARSLVNRHKTGIKLAVKLANSGAVQRPDVPLRNDSCMSVALVDMRVQAI